MTSKGVGTVRSVRAHAVPPKNPGTWKPPASAPAMKGYYIKLPHEMLRKLQHIADSETLATKYPVTVAHVIRKFIVLGMAEHERVNGRRGIA